MPRKCVVPNCRLQTDEEGCSILTFRQLPKDDKIKKNWIEALEKEFSKDKIAKSLNLKYIFVCDLHFEEKYFYYTGSGKSLFLQKEAYPSIFENFRIIGPKAIVEKYEKIYEATCTSQTQHSLTINDSILSINSSMEFSDNESESSINIKTDVGHKRKCFYEIGSKSMVHTDTAELKESVSVADSNLTHSYSNKFNDNESESIIIKNNDGKKRKPFHEIDLKSIDYNNIVEIKKLLKKVQREVLSKSRIIVKQRREIKNLRMQVFRYKARVKNVKSLLNHVKDRSLISEEGSTILKGTIPETAGHLIERLMYKQKTSKPFPNILKKFAATLQFYSPKGYNYVRNTFLKALPHPVSVRTWHRNIDCDSGINYSSIEAVRRKVEMQKKTNPEKEVLINLVMDEMSIKKSVQLFNGKEYGYIDVGKGVDSANELPQAENVLVLMAVCTNNKWKIAISFYFIIALNGEEKAQIVKDNLVALHETGAVVISITFDGLISNFGMCNHLEADISLSTNPIKNYFEHPISNKKIFIISDACHALKLIRNTFATQDLYDEHGKLISWSHIKCLVDVQLVNGLRISKLSQDHINWQNDKMKVRLAAQTLSESTSDSLKYCRDNLKLPQFAEIEGTAGFAHTINSAFDILNSRDLFTNNPSKECISEKNICLLVHKVENIISYIKGLKTKDGYSVIGSKRKTGFIGMIISLSSCLEIYNTYFKNHGGYLLTYKLSQDHIEVYFSAVRSSGGYTNNPTAYQFVHIFKKLLVHADIKGSDRGNCMLFNDSELLKIPENQIHKKTETASQNKELYHSVFLKIISLNLLIKK